MNRTKSNQSGFSPVETILVLIIIILIGVVGWLVYSKNHNKTDNSSKATPASASSKTADKPKTDPYAGWKSFCSKLGGLCLKYPASWQYKQSLNNGAQAGSELNTITSPSGKVVVVYAPDWQIGGTGENETYRVSKVTPTQSSDFVAVKLLFNCLTVQASTPYTSCPAEEFTVPASKDYVEGTTVSKYYGDGLEQFNNSHLSGSAATSNQRLFVTNDSQEFGQPSFPTSAAAQAWLNSPDATTAYNILTSAYYSPN